MQNSHQEGNHYFCVSSQKSHTKYKTYSNNGCQINKYDKKKVVRPRYTITKYMRLGQVTKNAKKKLLAVDQC